MRTTLDGFSHQRLGKCLLFYNMIDIDVLNKSFRNLRSLSTLAAL